jgi:hypothetical protein
MVKTAWECGFPGHEGVGTALAIHTSKASFLTQRRTAMKAKIETLMLQSLFGVCVLICAMSIGGMLLA